MSDQSSAGEKRRRPAITSTLKRSRLDREAAKAPCQQSIVSSFFLEQLLRSVYEARGEEFTSIDEAKEATKLSVPKKVMDLLIAYLGQRANATVNTSSAITRTLDLATTKGDHLQVAKYVAQRAGAPTFSIDNIRTDKDVSKFLTGPGTASLVRCSYATLQKSHDFKPCLSEDSAAEIGEVARHAGLILMNSPHKRLKEEQLREAIYNATGFAAVGGVRSKPRRKATVVDGDGSAAADEAQEDAASSEQGDDQAASEDDDQEGSSEEESEEGSEGSSSGSEEESEEEASGSEEGSSEEEESEDESQ